MSSTLTSLKSNFFMSFFRRIFLNLWYYRDPPWDTGISSPEPKDFIQTHPPGQALDLGCSTGPNVITFTRHEWQIALVDFVHQSG
ncbi:hypothetical protein ACFLUA_03100 [Chloroflexota bacterium]